MSKSVWDQTWNSSSGNSVEQVRRGADFQRDAGQITPGMQHGDQPQACKQESQSEAQAQRVIDGAGQHGQQHAGVERSIARRQDVELTRAL